MNSVKSNPIIYSYEEKQEKTFDIDIMEMKQIITATVAVILICLVAIPLIDTQTDTIRSSDNNVGMRYSLSEDESVKIEFVSSGNFIVNGEPVTITVDGNEYGRSYCILSDSIGILCANNSGKINWPGNTSSANTNFKTAGDYIEWSNGTWTMSIQGSTTTGTYTWLLVPDEKGDFGFWRSYSKGVWIDHDAPIFFYTDTETVSNGSVTSPAVIGKASLSGDISFKAFGGDGSTAQDLTSSTTMKINLKESGDLADQITNLTATYNGTSTVVTQFIAPIEYHYLNENEKTIKTVLSLIPVLLIVSLVVGIGYEIARRD